VSSDGNSLFQSLAMFLENTSYYFVLRYLIADGQCCVVLSTITKSVEIQRHLR
jgi:hypothetical protein